MKKENSSGKEPVKAKKDKATSGGGKDKNGGGLPASNLKVGGGGKDGRSGGKGA